MILGILNLEGYQNCMNGSKVTTILIMYEKIFTTPCLSWVPCQMSMSGVNCHMLQNKYKLVQLVCGRNVINGAYLVQFCSKKAKFSHKSCYVTNLVVRDFGLPILFEPKSFLKKYIYIVFKVQTKKGFPKNTCDTKPLQYFFCCRHNSCLSQNFS